MTCRGLGGHPARLGVTQGLGICYKDAAEVGVRGAMTECLSRSDQNVYTTSFWAEELAPRW